MKEKRGVGIYPLAWIRFKDFANIKTDIWDSHPKLIVSFIAPSIILGSIKAAHM